MFPKKAKNQLQLKMKLLYETPFIIFIYDLLLFHILVLKHFLSLLLTKETILFDSP